MGWVSPRAGMRVCSMPHEQGICLQARLRGLLHRPLDHLADPRPAEWQTGGPSLREPPARPLLRDPRRPRLPEVLRRPEARSGNVRRHPRGCHGAALADGTGNRARDLSARNHHLSRWIRSGRHLSLGFHSPSGKPIGMSAKGTIPSTAIAPSRIMGSQAGMPRISLTAVIRST